MLFVAINSGGKNREIFKIINALLILTQLIYPHFPTQFSIDILQSLVLTWSLSISTNGTKHKDTAVRVQGRTASRAPHTAPTAACTEPGPYRLWAPRRKPRRSGSTAMETGTLKGLCTLSPTTDSGLSTLCSQTSPAPYQIM